MFFVSRPMKIVNFPQKSDTAKRVVNFHLERDTFRNKIMEIVEAFACETIFSFFFSFFIIFHFFIFSFFVSHFFRSFIFFIF